jgi:uncharacterized protein YcfL
MQMKKLLLFVLLVLLVGCKPEAKEVLSKVVGSNITFNSSEFKGIDVSTPVWTSGEIVANVSPSIKITPKVDVKNDFNFYLRKPWPMYETESSTVTLVNGKKVPVKLITRVAIVNDSVLVKFGFLLLGLFIGTTLTLGVLSLLRIVFGKRFS